MKSIILRAHEAAGIPAGRVGLIVRPVTKENSTVLGYSSRQLWSHLHFNYEDADHKTFVDNSFNDGKWEYLHVPAWHPEDGSADCVSYRVRCAWELGDVLACRESWWAVEVPGEGIGNAFIVYDDEIIGGTPTPHTLRPLDSVRTYGRKSSTQLPLWAVRTYIRVVSVEVKRVRDVTWDEARAVGIDCPQHDFSGGMCVGYCKALLEKFGEQWNADNPKHPWETKPWAWFCRCEQTHPQTAGSSKLDEMQEA